MTINIITLTYCDKQGNRREVTQWLTRPYRLTYGGAMRALANERRKNHEQPMDDTYCVARIECATRAN